VEITGKTKVYGIIGCPIEHSLSPVFQAYFATQHHLDAVYVPYHVESSHLEVALNGLSALGVQGLNVTVPHKEAVLPYVQANADVIAIGASNTLLWQDNAWQALNTDWQGVSMVLEGTALSLKACTVLLFGAGGTARAVLHAANHQGIQQVLICNRSSERVNDLLKHAQSHYPDMACTSLAWEQEAVTAACQEAEIVINTTSIGLSASDRFPFHIAGKGWAMDAVYKPSGQTAFGDMIEARQFVDGLPMLVAQGAKSFAIWHPCSKPDILSALTWMENKLMREATRLPGWEGCI
jgi:shikimate dehydrogenase